VIKPGKGKAIVELYQLTNPYIFLPETYKRPVLSIAEIIDGNGEIESGTQVLVPTKAGLTIKENGNKLRLINLSDILAYIDNYR